MYGRSSRVGALTLFLITSVLAACESPRGAAVPSPGIPPQRRAEVRDPISSTCGTSVAVDTSGPVKCQFAERNYEGPFTVSAEKLANKKIASVSPKTGKTFIISAGKQSGYGSFSVSDTNSNTLSVGVAHLSSARGNLCIQPKDKTQVELPATAGITATIDFLFKPGSKGCNYVQIATGSDIDTPPHGALEAFGVPDGVSGSPRPLLTISVGQGIDGNGFFGDVYVVPGMQLKVSPELNFPDGTYYASITKTDGKRGFFVGIVAFVAKNGVLSVSHVRLPDGQPFPIAFAAYTSSIIALYPPGVIPPPVRPSPSPTGSATPPPTPFPTTSPLKNAYGRPPPASNTIFGTMSWDWPQPPCTGAPAPCQWTSQLVEGFTGDGYIEIPANFSGKVTFDAGLGYMEIFPPIKIDCPASYDVAAAIDGSGFINIPERDKWMGASCTITFSTLPPGFEGNYYTETLHLFSNGE
jgi:hypothetical protein